MTARSRSESDGPPDAGGAAAARRREIVTRRVLGAAPERAFRAWIEPGQLRRWWGPEGFTSTFQVFDPRPGGAWSLVLHGPDGTDYPDRFRFDEVVPAELIILEHLSGPRFQLTASFRERDGHTLLALEMLFESAAECARAQARVTEANRQMLDRLEAVLAEE
jgi:uncharacterized protein YndB with AHSA1/START domain